MTISDDTPDLDLRPNEAVCPVCNLAFTVTTPVASWGACRDCLADGLDAVAAQLVDVTGETAPAPDGLSPAGFTPSLFA